MGCHSSKAPTPSKPISNTTLLIAGALNDAKKEHHAEGAKPEDPSVSMKTEAPMDTETGAETHESQDMYKIADDVEIFSQSADDWVKGTVVGVADNGWRLTVRYLTGDRERQVCLKDTKVSDFLRKVEKVAEEAGGETASALDPTATDAEQSRNAEGGNTEVATKNLPENTSLGTKPEVDVKVALTAYDQGRGAIKEEVQKPKVVGAIAPKAPDAQSVRRERDSWCSGWVC